MSDLFDITDFIGLLSKVIVEYVILGEVAVRNSHIQTVNIYGSSKMVCEVFCEVAIGNVDVCRNICLAGNPGSADEYGSATIFGKINIFADNVLFC